MDFLGDCHFRGKKLKNCNFVCLIWSLSLRQPPAFPKHTNKKSWTNIQNGSEFDNLIFGFHDYHKILEKVKWMHVKKCQRVTKIFRRFFSNEQNKFVFFRCWFLLGAYYIIPTIRFKAQTPFTAIKQVWKAKELFFLSWTILYCYSINVSMLDLFFYFWYTFTKWDKIRLLETALVKNGLHRGGGGIGLPRPWNRRGRKCWTTRHRRKENN